MLQPKVVQFRPRPVIVVCVVIIGACLVAVLVETALFFPESIRRAGWGRTLFIFGTMELLLGTLTYLVVVGTLRTRLQFRSDGLAIRGFFKWRMVKYADITQVTSGKARTPTRGGSIASRCLRLDLRQNAPNQNHVLISPVMFNKKSRRGIDHQLQGHLPATIIRAKLDDL